jgi:tRNA nucleotidyltransferase/poly(A) polymerase
MGAVWTSVADYVHSLGLDAYVVGGAVRDELLGIPVQELDFVVPGVGHAELRAALEPHGRVEGPGRRRPAGWCPSPAPRP